MRVHGDLTDPARDTVPPRSAAPPLRAYVVCSTPRSGSGLLCRGLAATGAAATPLEYFNPVHREALSARWGCGPPLSGYLRALRRHRTTRDGVFGCKLHWDQLAALRAEAAGAPLEDLLGRAVYVRIRRRDLDRQAISLWFAFATGTWSVGAGEPAGGDGRPEVPYDFGGIERCRRTIEDQTRQWDAFLRERGIAPVEVCYEELDAAYGATVERVARALVPGARLGDVGPPPTRRLSDARTEELLARFRADRLSGDR